MTEVDYQYLIDEQIWAFIKKTQQAYPDNTVLLSIDEQRALYDAMCTQFRMDYPAAVVSSDMQIDSSCYSTIECCSTTQAGCLIRQYELKHRPVRNSNSGAQLVYLHGGGFVVGGLDSHDDICAEITDASTLPLTSVDYRLSPEHKHPAAFDDACAAVHFVWKQCQKPIILVGDSAGANLAAAISHSFRNNPIPIIGQVLLYPGLGGKLDGGSYIKFAHAPMLTTEEVRFYTDIRGGGDSQSDPTLAPLCDTDFSQLPPTVIISAQCDPLSDDGKHYQQAITAAGGLAHWINESGLVHGYLRARHQSDRARESFQRMLKAIDHLARGQWPY